MFSSLKLESSGVAERFAQRSCLRCLQLTCRHRKAAEIVKTRERVFYSNERHEEENGGMVRIRTWVA